MRLDSTWRVRFNHPFNVAAFDRLYNSRVSTSVLMWSNRKCSIFCTRRNLIGHKWSVLKSINLRYYFIIKFGKIPIKYGKSNLMILIIYSTHFACLQIAPSWRFTTSSRYKSEWISHDTINLAYTNFVCANDLRCCIITWLISLVLEEF